MSELLLVNPKRRRASTKRKRSSSGRFVKSASASPRKRRTVARKRRRNPSTALAANPSRRRRSTRSVAKRVTRRRRNPSARGVISQLMPAVKGAAGAALTDIAYRFLPTPGPLAMLKGQLAPLTRIATAFFTAKAVSYVGGKTLANQMLSGSLTVIAYGLLNEHVLSRLPVIGVGEYMSGLGYQDAAQSFTYNDQLPDSGMMDYGDSEMVGEYLSM